MKSTSKATTTYESPNCRAIEIDAQELICVSPTGRSNEEYEEVDTSDWFNR